jgi:Curlin associated repeat
MKAILLFLSILIAGFGSCSKVQATTFTDLKFGQYQIADSQWDVYACTQTTTCQIYSKNPGTAYKIPWTSGQIQWATGDYIGFLDNSNKDANNPWLAVQYGSNGVAKTNMGTGHIINMGSDYFFFVGNDNDTGQLFSMTQGFANTSGVTWTGTRNPTTTQVDAYAAGGSTTPLAAGETVQPSGPPPYPSYVTIGSGTAGTMTFNQTSNITSDQQTKVDLWTNRTVTDGNKIYIEQVSGYGNSVTMDQDGNKNLIRAKIEGNSNSITTNQGTQGIGQNEIKINTVGDSNTLNINQARTTQGTAIGGNGHYQTVDINGSNNTLTTQQSNSGGVGGHYMETTVNGNQNSITARQTDNSNKIMFTSISGNNNTVEAVQKGTGQHYLENKLTGNNNSVSAVQEGSTANRATLDLTNAGGPASVILQQNGGQNVTVITSCATAGGCAPITVRQGY